MQGPDGMRVSDETHEKGWMAWNTGSWAGQVSASPF
jgi:hypothetical protein